MVNTVAKCVLMYYIWLGCGGSTRPWGDLIDCRPIMSGWVRLQSKTGYSAITSVLAFFAKSFYCQNNTNQ